MDLQLLLFLTGTTSPKSRITKSNTMSNATGRAWTGQAPANNRRSAYETSKLSTSTEKANQAGAMADPRYVDYGVYLVKGWQFLLAQDVEHFTGQVLDD